MQKRMGKLSATLCLTAVLALASSMWGQSLVTGGLSGIVTDRSGAVVNDVRLTLKSEENGAEFSVMSSGNGDYVFALLKPGRYVLTAKKEGFQTSKSSVSVQVGATVRFNVSLEIGTASTTVEVTGETPLLQTESADISTTFESQQIHEIPNPGGDITYIAQTAPGVVMNSNGFGYGNFSTFGLPGTSNLFTVNGNDYNDPFFNLNNSGASNLTLGSNELDEVSVTSNAYTAQFGRQAGTQIDYATKSGTNSWHGDAVYYWTGRYLNANDPINLASGNPRPFENNNQWAASIGGPIVKNKLFFFSNFEGLRYIFGTVSNTITPTPAFEAATLANIPQDSATLAFYNNIFSLYNKAPGIASAQPLAGSCSQFGLPQLAASPVNDECLQQWTGSGSSGNHEYLFSTKLDYVLSPNDRFSGRMKFDRGVQPTYTDPINSAFNTFSTQPQDEGQLNYTHIFSPQVTNNFIGSVLYYSALFGAISSGSEALKLFPGNLEFPQGGFSALGFGSGTGGYAQAFYFPQGRNVTQWGLVDDLSITRGNHTFKMGINFRRDDVGDHAASQVAFYPAINTTMADFFNDQLTSSSFTNYNFAKQLAESEAFYSFGLYFQDEFHVTPRLKLIMALRGDRNSGGICHGGCSGYPILPFQELQHGADIPYNQSFQTGLSTLAPGNEMAVFQPRFGLTYNPGGKNTVIRTGVGLFSDLYPAALLGPLDQNFPVVNIWNLNGTGTQSLAWDLNPSSSTAFPNSGVQLVAQCNGAFNQNYAAGGNLNTYLALAPNCGGGVPGLYDVTRNMKNPKYVEWNLEVQHSFGANLVFSANYVGNRGFDELYRDPYLNAFGFGNLPATVPDPRVASVVQVQNGGVSNYNGITLSLQERSWHGLSGRVNYTYSHSLDDISNAGILPYAVFTSVFTLIDPSNIHNDYGPADYDSRHSLTASYIYQLPLKSHNRFLNAAIGGWQLSGTLFAHTGFPFSVVDQADVAALQPNNISQPSLNGAAGAIVLQPQFAKRNFSNSDARSCVASPCFGGGAEALNPGAPYQFAVPTNFIGPVVGRNAFRGPGFLGGDMSVRKNFKVTERVDFQLGLDAYNFLNHANFGVPFASTAFGAAFGLTGTTQFTPTSPYGAFATAATDMRIAQIQGKITF
ncbi:MAG TPA: carboxypeptidase regulatory-like domain-containing protein [Candidatus Sulfotelmatobacter sp.]|nr:carboxypeptidase regulatory-like domain-containing protein [Candidatus Sulfotelmatobacter sp.]